MEYLKDYWFTEQEMAIVSKASQKFHKMIEDNKLDPYSLAGHIEELQKWGQFALKHHPDMDPFVLFLAIFLHDAGHYPIIQQDHAITWEIIARQFLEQEGVAQELIDKVAHCVRSHRCRDVLPQTEEAKMMTTIDSATHFTDPLFYLNVLVHPAFPKSNILELYDHLEAKMDRDYRDVQLYPEIQQKIEPLYTAWKELLKQKRPNCNPKCTNIEKE